MISYKSKRIHLLLKFARRILLFCRTFISFTSATKRVKLMENNRKVFHSLHFEEDKARTLFENLLASDALKQSNYSCQQMRSEHEILLAGISLSKPKIGDILEIGTHLGFTTQLLHELFPEANITTIDLPYENIEFSNMYRKDHRSEDFLNKRSRCLDSDGIHFLEMNSVELVKSQKSFDLIYIDGNHAYPHVAIDIANGVRLIRAGGIVIVDDVYSNAESENLRNTSRLGAYKTIDVMQKCGLVKDVKYIYKRLEAKNNLKWNSKYIAILSFN